VEQGGAGVERKPLYVDFTNLGALGLLDDLLDGGNGNLTVSEMLPDPDQLWLRSDAGDHVTELVIELTREPEAPR
jgi:hypothetical protein